MSSASLEAEAPGDSKSESVIEDDQDSDSTAGISEPGALYIPTISRNVILCCVYDLSCRCIIFIRWLNKLFVNLWNPEAKMKIGDIGLMNRLWNSLLVYYFAQKRFRLLDLATDDPKSYLRLKLCDSFFVMGVCFC